MATYFDCPYVSAQVELTDEREAHIAEEHPEIDPTHIAGALEHPDSVRLSGRASNSRLFVRWYDDLVGGKYAVVVVVTDPPPSQRRWIVTAYPATRLSSRGAVEWERS
jgi:hypothetical protein